MDNNNIKNEKKIIINKNFNGINHNNKKQFNFIDNNFNFNQIKKMVPLKLNDDFIKEKNDNNNQIKYLKKKRKFISIGKKCHNKIIDKNFNEKNDSENIKIKIEIIQLKNNLDNQIKINNIYSYLEKDFFDDSLKEFSYYFSNEKLNLYDKIKQKNDIFNENIELNFGDNPIKIYKQSLYNNKINENNKDYLKIQQLISISPVLINNNFEYINDSNCSDNIIKLNMNINNNNYIINNKNNKNNNKNNNILKKPVKNNKNYNGEKIYYCNFCNLKFINPQSLGGHMSRLHKYKSEKFLKKKETRNRREPLRNLLYLAKKILFENFYEFRENIDYETFKKTKQFKKIIKELILKYKKEYKQIKNELFQQIKQ